MTALQFIGDDQCAVNELDVPAIADDEVLLASRSVGICHSDIELLAGRYIIPFEFPVIPGHEWAGEVVQVGPDGAAASASATGSSASASSAPSTSASASAVPPPSFFVAKEAWLHRLPDNLSWTQGALVEPFSCGYYATVRADNLDASDTAVVLGAGPDRPWRGRGRRRPRARGSSWPSRTRTRATSPARSGPRTSSTRRPTTSSTPSPRRPTAAARTSSSRPAASRPRWPTALEVAGFRARLVYIGIDVGGQRAGAARA